MSPSPETPATCWAVNTSGGITGADVCRPAPGSFWPVNPSLHLTGADIAMPVQPARLDAAMDTNLSIAPLTASRMAASQVPTNRSMSSSSGSAPASAYGMRKAIALTTAALTVMALGLLWWGR